MANDRDKAFEVSNDGLLFEGAAHIASGSGAPSHTGLKGDMYFDVTNNHAYTLLANGSSWTKIPFVIEQSDGFTITGGSSGSRTLDVNSGNVEIIGSGSATITFPSSTSTLATTALSETLTNKTLGSGTKVSIGSDGTGDMYYRDASGNLTRIAAGTDGQYMNLSGGIPNWADGSVPLRCMHFSSGSDSVTATRYIGYANADTTAAHVQRICPALSDIVAIYCLRENTSAEGKFHVYKNGTEITALATSITAGNTTASTTGLSSTATFNGSTDIILVEVEEVGAGPISGNYQCLIYYVASSP